MYRDIGLGDGENMRPILSRRSELPVEATVEMKLRGNLDLYEGNRPFVRDNTRLRSYPITRKDFLI